MKKTSKIRVLVVTIVLLLSFALSLGAQARSSDFVPAQLGSVNTTKGDGLTVTKTITKAEEKVILNQWTREAIAAAQPMDLLAQSGPAEVDAAALAAPEATGPAGFSLPGAPAPGADQVARAAYAKDWAALEASPDQAAVLPDAPEGTSQTYTSYVVNQYSPLQRIYPHIWVGRLSFTTPTGTSYCSATSISGNNILTAAHCVYDTTNNRFYTNWVFTPAYRAGNAPYGTFAWRSCTVLTLWVNLTGSFAINTWTRHDVALCKMGNNSAGQTLNAAVGFMGRQWNFPYVRHFHNLGYPFRDYNNALLTNAGLYLRTCVAESFTQTTETRGMGCNWGGGISGGPWTIAYAPNVVSGYADGVNSGIFIGTQNIYGARFNSNNIVVLCTSVGC